MKASCPTGFSMNPFDLLEIIYAGVENFSLQKLALFRLSENNGSLDTLYTVSYNVAEVYVLQKVLEI